MTDREVNSALRAQERIKELESRLAITVEALRMANEAHAASLAPPTDAEIAAALTEIYSYPLGTPAYSRMRAVLLQFVTQRGE